MAKKVKRLYEQLQPENYKLKINLDHRGLKFSGKVLIKAKKTGRPSQRITLHQKDLTVRSAKLKHFNKSEATEIKIDRINTHKSKDELRLHAPRLLYPGQYEIEIEFESTISDAMHGVYPCYFQKGGKKNWLLATQFESHHAREVFPCIDEPEAKATYDLELTGPKDLVFLSNTQETNSKISGGSKTVIFQTTPIMSTYLLAFVVGDIHGVSGKTKNGIEVRSWAASIHPKSHLEYANKEAIDTLDLFEEYFQTPFPLKKLDQVALPDFESLAMENWGLVTYRDMGLLADPKNRSLSGEQLITMVIAHELSHQWFGNLVTMKWWDDLWLNESFASVMETLAPDRLHPDWEAWEDFVSSRIIGAALRDIYKDVQPVGVNVTHPDEIHSLFDPSIVYAKGARLIKMLYEYIGEEKFSDALKNYFKNHAFANTVRDDLWKEVEKVSKRDIKAMMSPWIEKSGTPVVSIKKSGGQLSLSQQRFLLDDRGDSSIWPIPLLADQEIGLEVFDSKSAKLKLDSAKMPILNYRGYAHFISHYDDQLLENIRQKIIDREIEPTGRIVAINDMLLLSQKGMYSITDMLELIEKCTHEDRDAVWSIFARALGSTQTLIDGEDELEKKLREFKRQLASYWHTELGWDDTPSDDPNTKHLRHTALALTLGGEDEDAIQTALERYKKAKNIEDLPAEQRAMILATVVKFGEASEISKLMSEYEKTPRSDIQEAITSGLTASKDKEVAKRLIEWGLAMNGAVRPQDVLHWFAYMMRNRHSRDEAWKWLESIWDNLGQRIGGSKSMDYIVRYAAGPLSTPQWQDSFDSFFVPKKKVVGLERNINIAQNQIQSLVDWRKRDLPKIKKFLI